LFCVIVKLSMCSPLATNLVIHTWSPWRVICVMFTWTDQLSTHQHFHITCFSITFKLCWISLSAFSEILLVYDSCTEVSVVTFPYSILQFGSTLPLFSLLPHSPA
jgi:hypothetical protein